MLNFLFNRSTLLFFCICFCYVDTAQAAQTIEDVYKKYPPNALKSSIKLEEKLAAHTAFLKEAKLPQEQALLLLLIGLDYTSAANYQQAIYHILEAEKKMAGNDDAAIWGELLSSKGMIYLKLEKFEESKKHYEKAILYFRQIRDSLPIGKCLGEMATVYSRMGDYTKSAALLEQALKIFKQLGRDDLVHSCTFNYSTDLLLNNKPKEALPYIYQTLHEDSVRNNLADLARGFGNLAYAYGLLKDYERAFFYYDQSIGIAREANLNDVVYVCYQDMSDTYAAKGDWKESLVYYKKYIALRDSIIGSETQQKIIEIESKFENQQKELQLKALSQKVVQRNFWIVLAILALALTFLAFWKVRGDRSRDQEIHSTKEALMQRTLDLKALENAQLENKYVSQRQDLQDFGLDISRKNIFAETVHERLEDLSKLPATKVSQGIRELQSFVQSNQFVDKEKAVFQKKADEVNRAFFQKLDEVFGTLSPAEKELCGFIRLGLNNKDIAALKGISPSSAKMGRYRLRKRLSLDENIDIATFLQNI